MPDNLAAACLANLPVFLSRVGGRIWLGIPRRKTLGTQLVGENLGILDFDAVELGYCP
jgi:hypothetical protein